MVWYKVIYENETWSRHNSLEELIETVKFHKNNGLEVKTAFHVVENEFTSTELELFFDKKNTKLKK